MSAEAITIPRPMPAATQEPAFERQPRSHGGWEVLTLSLFAPTHPKYDTRVDSRQTRRLITLLMSLALALGAVQSTLHFIGMRTTAQAWSWSHAVSMGVPFWALWAAFTPLVVRFAGGVAAWRLPWPGMLARHLLVAAGLSGIHTFLVVAIAYLTATHDWPRGFLANIVDEGTWNLAPNLLAYGVLAGVTHATASGHETRARELQTTILQAQLAEARLAALRARLQPHFLYNALNSVSMLVRGNRPADAVEAVTALSDLLRYVLRDYPGGMAPLRDELSFVESYLAIERLRFGERIQAHVDVPESLLQREVPHLVLQPLVENAVRHGVAPTEKAGELRIIARQSGSALELDVVDDGAGPEEPAIEGAGIGLRATRERLTRMYGGAARLTLESGELGGTVARVRIPLDRGTAASV